MQNTQVPASIADFDGLPVAAVIADVDGGVVALNQIAMRAIGNAVGEKLWRYVLHLEAEWLLITTGDYCGAHELLTKDATLAVQVVTAVRDGYVVALMIESVCETAERIAAKQRLESLGLVAGGVAHEFNNQLVSVVADAATVREDDTLSEPTRDALGRIEAAARRMTQLTRQLLAFAGRGRFVTTLLDPDVLLADSRERLAHILRPATKLEVVLGAGTVAIEADRGLLRQVIVDLVENANEALPEGAGEIAITSAIVTSEGEQWWQVSVRDTGIGMDAATRARILDPFFSTKADHRGLGLSAVLGIVRRLGGTLEVESALGRGATFTIRLPIVPGVAPPRRRSTSKQPPLERLSGLRILVADDEPTVRATVKRLLERRAATVVLAIDGAAAEALMRTEQFDLVLLDVMMPKKTGYELVSVARETQPHAPVVLMSGYSDQARGVEPPDGFVEKPFNSAMLEAALQAAMRGDPGRPGSES